MIEYPHYWQESPLHNLAAILIRPIAILLLLGLWLAMAAAQFSQVLLPKLSQYAPG